MRMILGLAAATTLAACATMDGDGDMKIKEPQGECDASGVQDHVGHKASAESGTMLLKMTGAKTLRWVPPRTAVTMDYRPDRLTVSYDDDYTITKISCG
ncbi:I78 family peptidase inhibitor [Paraurantiacibacter namhicola]|uniref:Peptidase inhibitor I78 family protein n=1 Tax=Paraurantiacibacter namhicola TaxID=645517 RepID=A0A1C7D780_9SPHN|nr:I78 family peptidase inhibitor [Paraurantiacibacter namhicola]ANU07212.1 Peptidase inhibitor I78 family protein [Paraurantiacibacter namhicola]